MLQETDDRFSQALSAFAEYVEEQQNIRYPAGQSAEAAEPETGETGEHHEELDELFNNLELSETAPQVPLKELLLGSDEETLEQLEKVVADRIAEGFGETVFELGYENNGASMRLSVEEWSAAYARLEEASKRTRANCQLLITKNVGGEKEAPSTAKKPSKDKSCSGKVLIRQIPKRVEDVIETRIAVVGNGEYLPMHYASPLTPISRRGQELSAGSAS